MDFYRRVGIVCRHIPPGKVATYGQIALLCGRPKNSRQVGYGLKRGLAGEDVPAYRVVNAKGILSGAFHFETHDLQKILLTEDGVEVIWTPEGWKVDLKKFGWRNTMEEALALREEFAAREEAAAQEESAVQEEPAVREDAAARSAGGGIREL